MVFELDTTDICCRINKGESDAEDESSEPDVELLKTPLIAEDDPVRRSISVTLVRV